MLDKFHAILNRSGEENLVQNVFDIVDLVAGLHKAVIPFLIRRLRSVVLFPPDQQMQIIAEDAIAVILGFFDFLFRPDLPDHRMIPYPMVRLFIRDPERVRELHGCVLL